MNKKAIVTVVIGDYTTNGWKQYFLPTWEPYAKKHGYDIVPITGFIDSNPKNRTANWQKLLILEHPDVQRYEDVVWLDADILVNHHTAPCIVDHHASDKVGLVSDNDYNFLLPSNCANQRGRLARIYKWDKIPTGLDAYRRAGFGEEVSDYANTGVMVLRNELHRPVLREIYDRYDEKPTTAKEELPTCWHLFKHDLVKRLDTRFNRIWLWEMIENHPHIRRPEYRRNPTATHRLLMRIAATTIWHNSWFTHFTIDGFRDSDNEFYSCREDVQYVDTSVSDILDLALDIDG